MTFGPLMIRIAIGAISIINGWPKIMDIKQTQGFFMIIGLFEVVGGILLVGGILTRIMAFLLYSHNVNCWLSLSYLCLLQMKNIFCFYCNIEKYSCYTSIIYQNKKSQGFTGL
jgi:DoxX-like protein